MRKTTAYHPTMPPIGYSFLAFMIFLIAGVKAYQSRVNVVCFNSHDGRRLFSIFGNKPSVSDVEDFCKKLGKRIERIRYSGEISNERMIELLKKHVDFLLEQEVLGEAEAKLALDRISGKYKLSVLSFSRNENV